MDNRTNVLLDVIRGKKEIVIQAQERLKEVNNILEAAKEKYNINKEQGTLTMAQTIHVEELIKTVEYLKTHEVYFKLFAFSLKSCVLNYFPNCDNSKAHQMGLNNTQYLRYLNAEILDFLKSKNNEELAKLAEDLEKRIIPCQGKKEYNDYINSFLNVVYDNKYFAPIKLYASGNFDVRIGDIKWDYDSLSELVEIDDNFENEKPKSR